MASDTLKLQPLTLKEVQRPLVAAQVAPPPALIASHVQACRVGRLL